jgi:hypothetical protein
MNAHDILTVVRDPAHVLGKQFSFADDGVTVVKISAVYLSLGVAIQRHVPNITAMNKLLAEVAEDSHAAIINAAFPSVPVGAEFLILSEDELKKRGVKRNDNSGIWPVTIDYDGAAWPALGRFMEHQVPSSWLLLDRDVDEHTPKKYADLDYDGWLTEVNKLLPGIVQCARLRAHSSSARVSINGKPVGGGNGHTWIQVVNPDDIKRIRSAVKARALDLGMAWTKPRHSKSTGEVVGNDVVSIIDWSVFTTGRLVFVGKPEVRDAI